MIKCIECGSENVKLLTDNENTFNYRGTTLLAPMDYSVCEECGQEFIGTTQIIENDKRAREARKTVDGLLSAKEIKTIRERLRLTQEEAAQVFGGGKNAFSKYERAEVCHSVSMDKLIRAANQVPALFYWLVSISEINKSKSNSLLAGTSYAEPKILETIKSLVDVCNHLTAVTYTTQSASEVRSIVLQHKPSMTDIATPVIKKVHGIKRYA